MSGLSFSGLPPIDIPFRFFSTAIAFVIGLAIFVIFAGDSLWFSRWQPSMLALTHGFTLGFITPVMMGALLQMLPVVGGIGVKNVRQVADICHPLHFVGTGLLMWGFVSTSSWQPTIKLMAIISLASSFSIYIFSVLRVLWQYYNQRLSNNVISQNPTIFGIALSILALVVTVLMGLLLQGQNIGFSLLSGINVDKSLTNTHALWGGIGWMGMLIMAVSLQVIPMFHVAPSFPKFSARILPITLFIALLITLTSSNIGSVVVEFYLLDFIWGIFMLFNVVLLNVIRQRKRKIPDMTINCWRVAVISLAIIFLLYFTPDSWLKTELLGKKSMMLSAAFIYFYLLTIILGMLFKILPFLSYTHLQQRCLVNFDAMQHLPNMHELLNKKMTKVLFYCHLATGFSLILTIVNPKLYWFFSTLLLVEFSIFFVLILQTCRVYYRCSQAIKKTEDEVNN